nr:hypothetical protein [Tanacetum cinerariifolium]
YKVINTNLNRCYEELSKANTHLRTTYLETIAAQKAEIATLNAKTVGNKTSGTTNPTNPKVITLRMYAISPKYIVPQKRTNRETPIPLPKKKQVTFQETPKPSPRFIKKPIAPQLKKPNVNVPLSTGIESATRASKPASKRNAWIYRKLPAKSAKSEKVEEHIRNLNKNNRVDSHVKRSISVKNLNVVCEPIELSLCVSSSIKIPMLSKFVAVTLGMESSTDCSLAKENPYVQRYQTMKKWPQTEAQAQRNMMMYLKNTAGFRLDYFKGKSYDDICLIFEANFNSNIEFILKTKERIEEEKNRAIASINETPAQRGEG